MRTRFTLCLYLLTALCLPAVGQVARYWVGTSVYQNNFQSAADLADWSLIENNGTGSWMMTDHGSAILRVDNVAGSYAVRLFSVNGSAVRLLPLDRINGVVEFQVLALTGGDQRFFLQAQEFNASGVYITEQNILPSSATPGYYAVNMSAISWNPATTQVRFMIAAANYSGQQGTVEFNYFNYSNTIKSWNNVSNWSATSGGPGGASVPGASDHAIFNGASGTHGLCFLAAPVTINNLTISGYAGTIDLRGYSLTVNGAASLGSGNITVTGGGTSLTLNTTGTTTFNGTVFQVGITGTTGRLFLHGSTFYGDVNLIRTGGLSDDSNGGNVFYGAATFTNTGSGRLRMASTTGDVFYGPVSLVRTAGALQFAYAGTTTLHGNLSTNTNSASNLTFGTGGGSIAFSGTNAQTISYTPGSVAPTFSRLIVNKSANTLTLAAPVTISTAATFTAGVVETTGANPLIFDGWATTAGASDASYVDGPVRKALGLLEGFTFPIGDGGRYRPAGISAILGGTYTAQYFKAQQPYGSNKVAGLATVSQCEYWNIDRNAGLEASLTLTWQSATCSSSNYITNMSALRVAHWNGSQWEIMPLELGSPAGNAVAGTVSTLSIASFSPFTLGSTSPANPLPVTWEDFRGFTDNGKALLEWSTASEKNNAFFEVQRSASGKDFTAIGIVPGHGTTTEKQAYTFTDPDLLMEPMYYRLRQVDYDGGEDYSDVIRVRIPSELDRQPLRLYPNPATAPVVYLNKRTSVVVTNMLGRTMYTAAEMQQIDTSGWPAGIYHVTDAFGQHAALIVP
jgi:hypothetical protein